MAREVPVRARARALFVFSTGTALLYGTGVRAQGVSCCGNVERRGRAPGVPGRRGTGPRVAGVDRGPGVGPSPGPAHII